MVIASVYGALTASGAAPTLASSTAMLTVKPARFSAVPAFRYRPLASTSNDPASGPVTESAFVPRPSSAIATPATFTRCAVLVVFGSDAIGFVSETAVGGWLAPADGA